MVEEQLKEITSDRVEIDQHNAEMYFQRWNKELNKLPLPVHGTIVNLLQSAVALRQTSMQLALEERKAQEQTAQHEAQKKAFEAARKAQEESKLSLKTQ